MDQQIKSTYSGRSRPGVIPLSFKISPKIRSFSATNSVHASERLFNRIKRIIASNNIYTKIIGKSATDFRNPLQNC